MPSPWRPTVTTSLMGAFAALVLGLFVVPPASAQLNPDVDVRADQATVSLGPNGTADVVWTVRNAGPLEGTITLTTGAPSGWTVEIPPNDANFTLAAGASRAVSTHVAASGNKDAAPMDGAWTVEAVLRDGLGQTDRADAVVALDFLPPPAPAPVPASPQPPDYSGEIASGIGGLLALLGLGVYGWQARRVSLHPEFEQRDVSLGDYAIVQVDVTNRSSLACTARIRVAGLPPTWGGAFSADRVRLEPRETVRVPVFLRLPFNEDGGKERRLRLQVRPNAFSPWWVQRQLRIRPIDLPAHMRGQREGVPRVEAAADEALRGPAS